MLPQIERKWNELTGGKDKHVWYLYPKHDYPMNTALEASPGDLMNSRDIKHDTYTDEWYFCNISSSQKNAQLWTQSLQSITIKVELKLRDINVPLQRERKVMCFLTLHSPTLRPIQSHGASCGGPIQIVKKIAVICNLTGVGQDPLGRDISTYNKSRYSSQLNQLEANGFVTEISRYQTIRNKKCNSNMIQEPLHTTRSSELFKLTLWC